MRHSPRPGFSFETRLLTKPLPPPPAGPNAISVSLSPMGCYVMVGLASRRILLHPTTDHMVAQVFRLQQPHGGETSMRVRPFVWRRTPGRSSAPRPGTKIMLCVCGSDGLQRGLPHGSGPEASRQHQLCSLAAGPRHGPGLRNQQGRPGHLPARVSPPGPVSCATTTQWQFVCL